MTTLVTGATGLLGNNVVRALLDRGESVGVLVRSGSDPRCLDGLDVEVTEGDIRDVDAVRTAMRGADQVVHSAGLVRIGWSDPESFREINVQGARNVAQEARQQGARMVHVSAINAIGMAAKGTPVSEDDAKPGILPCPYVTSKTASEVVVQDEIKAGLDAVIVNPGFMLGPWDWKPSSGQMLLSAATRVIPMAPSGGFNVCDVRDVSDGVLQALKRGMTGRRYILGGENMSYLEAFRRFARAGGRRGPICRMGPLIRICVGAYGDVVGKVTGREPEVNSAAIKLSSQFHLFRSDRAVQELGYRLRPLDETVEAAWEWFRQYGYV